jgi:hypothetical protein
MIQEQAMKTPSPQAPVTGRERVLRALNHQPADRVPVDLGGTACSGAHVSVVARLRRALGLDKPGDRVKVVEPYQILGEIAPDLRQALGIDVVHLPNARNMFGYETPAGNRGGLSTAPMFSSPPTSTPTRSPTARS